jgi:AcrR family transcriptional regulator
MATRTSPRALRADAQRNHDAIVRAAQEAFAGAGYGVSIEEIAHRAGVGAATVYRRFPSKELLLRAIFDAGIAGLEREIAAAQAAPDPWQGLLAGIRAVIEKQAENMVFVELLAELGVLPELKGEIRKRVFAPLGELFARAQAAGELRGDLVASELPLLIGMVVATAKHGSKSRAPVRWQRYLALLTDALRTPAPTPLPPR